MNVPVCLLDLVLGGGGADTQLVIELGLFDHLGWFVVLKTRLSSGNRWVVVEVAVAVTVADDVCLATRSEVGRVRSELSCVPRTGQVAGDAGESTTSNWKVLSVER